MSAVRLPGPRRPADAASTAPPVYRDALRGVDTHRRLLVAVSHHLHSRPETAYREWEASRLLAGLLAAAGFDVERPAFGIGTAFAARLGRSGPHVVLCCEYDALPGLGHACGHNVVAAAGLGAGLALAGLRRPLPGRVTVLGTPAEEGGAGKIRLLEAGAFDGVDAAMMVHPHGHETVRPRVLALADLLVTYRGLAAHASLAPELGVNALDGLVLGYVGLSALRQHLPAGQRVHGIVTAGGTAPGVVPDRADGRFLVRAPDRPALESLVGRVLDALRGGAQATGSRLQVRHGPVHDAFRHDEALAAAFERHCRALGRRPVPVEALPPQMAGSTDMGNVSQVVRAIHPWLCIAPGAAPHTEAFRRAAVGPGADRAVRDGAAALALTALDMWTGRRSDGSPSGLRPAGRGGRGGSGRGTG